MSEIATTVKITGATVHLREKLNWGQLQALRGTVQTGIKITQNVKAPDEQRMEFDPEATMRSVYKALSICIKNIELDDGKIVGYSNEWMDALDAEDGDAVLAAVNALADSAKKK